MIIKPYQSEYYKECLAIFDENCPEYFAPNERADYQHYLENKPNAYFLVMMRGKVIGAFGLPIEQEHNVSTITWIMIRSHYQRMGIGHKIMKHIDDTVRRQHVSVIKIAASHLSAPFFAKFGANTITRVEHGWGPNMHRIDMKLTIR